MPLVKHDQDFKKHKQMCKQGSISTYDYDMIRCQHCVGRPMIMIQVLTHALAARQNTSKIDRGKLHLTLSSQYPW